MSHHSTVIAQLLKLVPRHEFEGLARSHHRGRKLRKMTRWNQFVAMAFAQLSGRNSLRDLVSNLAAQGRRLYHVGCTRVTRSSLARVNESQPYRLFEAVAAKLLRHCQARAPKHRFRFKNPLYSLDASIIDLTLSVFPWATFRRAKGGIRLNVGLDHSGYLPAFVTATEASQHEMVWARTLALPPASMVVFDRAFYDFAWLKRLNDKKIFFITRLKKNTLYRVVERRSVARYAHITSDQTIRLSGRTRAQRCPIKLRRIGYRDPISGRHFVYFTNAFHLSPQTVAAVYKERWQIELFFKWIKQNLKIKSFLGTSKNAVLTQIWIAICMYLLLAYLKLVNGVQQSLQQILRILQLNLFERRELVPLIRGAPPDPETPSPQTQLAFA